MRNANKCPSVFRIHDKKFKVKNLSENLYIEHIET